jgi:hypothetical protein
MPVGIEARVVALFASKIVRVVLRFKSDAVLIKDLARRPACYTPGECKALAETFAVQADQAVAFRARAMKRQ